LIEKISVFHLQCDYVERSRKFRFFNKCDYVTHCAETDQRGLWRALFGISTSFLLRAPLAGYVSATPASAANAAAARFSRLGFEPARKKTLAVSHHSLNVVL